MKCYRLLPLINFHVGKLLPALTVFSITSWRIAWGNVSVDDSCHPTALKVHWRVSKCDQLGKEV